MRAIHVLTACVAVALAATAPVMAGESCCAKLKATNGWCDGCNHGFMWGVAISNAKLHQSLAGKTMEADQLHCPACKSAYASNGVCEHCKVMFVDHVEYTSPVSYTLAMGQVVEADNVKCPGCAKAMADNGYCDHCDGGIVAGRFFKGKDAYNNAMAAYETLVKAAAASCPECGVAMVTDGACAHCNAKYKDGQKI